MLGQEITKLEIPTPTIAEIVSAQKEGQSGSFRIKLPRYQRGVVWTETQQKKLIESIFNGFPIGSMLGYRTGEKDTSGPTPRDVVELVDGLQRATTIINFMDRPLAYSPVTELFEPDVIKALNEKFFRLHTNLEEDAVAVLRAWASETGTTKQGDGFTADSILTHFKSVEGAPNLSSEEETALTSMLAESLDNISVLLQKVNQVKIPLITYLGSPDKVPEIFERINSQGIKLSKYEKFAAAWIHTPTHIENVEIQDAIKAKYQKLVSAGYEVTELGSNIEIEQGEYNIFEYLFGLGKLLAKKFPLLFPEPGEPDESPASGFVLASVAFGLKVSDMARLNTELTSRCNVNGVVRMDDFESALIQSCQEVEDTLRPFLGLKLNEQTGGARFLVHSQNQIFSLVLRYLIEAYDFATWQKRKDSNRALLLKNVPAYYLWDIIHGVWAGSGDSRLWNVVWNSPEDGGGKLAPASHYLEPITADRWYPALENWHLEQLQKRQTKRANVNGSAKVFLKFLYAKIVNFHENAGVVFDIEHLMPVAVLSAAIQASGEPEEGWPISTLGNLALLPASLNRKKADQPLGDFLSTPKGKQTSLADLDRLQAFVITPDIHEIRVDPDMTRESYAEFCRSRFEVVAKQLVTGLTT